MTSEALFAFIAIVAPAMVIIFGMRALAVGVFPRRVELFELCNEILREARTKQADRRYLNYLMDHSLSFSGGWVIVRACWHGLRGELTGCAAARPTGIDQRVHKATHLYIQSAFAANPIAAITSFAIATVALAIRRRRLRSPARYIDYAVEGKLAFAR